MLCATGSLVVQAENDPIAPARGIPRADIEVDSMFTIFTLFLSLLQCFPWSVVGSTQASDPHKERAGCCVF